MRRISKRAKINTFLALLVCVFTLVGICVLRGSVFAATKAQRTQACETPVNVNEVLGIRNYQHLMTVNSTKGLVPSFSKLGGDEAGDEGVHWACNSWSGSEFTPSGIIFIVDHISKSAKVETYPGSGYWYPIYTLYTDIDTSSGGDVTATLAGLVHWDDDNYSNDQGAVYVGFCKTEADCSPAASGVNNSAASGDAGGIVKRGSGNIQFMRQVSGLNNSQASYGLWTEPLSGYGDYFPEITISGKKLRQAVDDGSVQKDINEDGYGSVKLYIHRCWSNDGQTKSGTCRVGKVYLTVQLPPAGWTATFSGEIGITSVSGTKKTENGKVIYYTEDANPTATFTHYVERTDDASGAPQDLSIAWKSFRNTTADKVDQNSSTPYSGNKSLSKQSGLKDVHTHSHTTSTAEINLTEGQTKSVCDTIGYISSINNDGSNTTNGPWVDTDNCVKFHRYAWYSLEGRVVAVNDDDTSESEGVYWTDTNVAKLRFKHQFKTSAPAKIKADFATSKSPDPGSTFNVQSNYAAGDLIENDGKWHNYYLSPSGGAAAVNVAKDTGTKYCQTLNYYPETREDSGNFRGTPVTKSDCITFKRYKTTFTGATEIFLGDDTETNYADDGKYEIKASKYTKYPAQLKVTFKHTVTRSSKETDEHGSPKTKSSSTFTKIFDGESGGTYGYRNVGSTPDPHGSELPSAPSEALAAGGSDYRTDSFTVNVYPEQTIHLCQQMTYTSEIQGSDATQSATGNKACVTITMTRAACYDEDIQQNFGIKDAKNMMKVDIYKNSANKPNKTSGVKAEGDSAITAWAQPGDQIRFNYEACAGGELSRQYAGSTTTTSYDITGQSDKQYYKADDTLDTDSSAGYLFGDTLTSSPYNDLSMNFGSSNATVGKGPFSDVYTREATSPHGDSIYSCDQFGTSNRHADFYRISNYIKNVTKEAYSTNCKSDDYGYASDLGTTIIQKVTWTDIQYSSGSVVSGHNGKTASITASVSIPYNYTTSIDVSGDGGYILPGNKHTERIKLSIDERKNSPVSKEEYATTSKPSEYRLIEINIDSNNSTDPDTFNGLVNDNKNSYYDTKGTADLANKNSGLPVCKSFNCSIVKSGSGQYDPGSHTISEDYSPTIPYNAEPGTKICYIAAIWPSDSHNLPNASDISVAQEAAGLDPRGTYWQVSGASCYTVSKRPSFNVLGGDTYAQGRISARTQKYPKNNAGADPRIYGSWTEYAAISGLSLKGYASGASLWGGSSIVSDGNGKSLNCIFSSYTFANASCGGNNGSLGSAKIATTSSSNPENIAGQMITRYTRTDSTGKMHATGSDPIRVEDGGICKYDEEQGTYVPYNVAQGATFACIGDTGAKYTHVDNTGNQVAYIPGEVNYCMGKGDTFNSRTSIIHSDGTLVVGANMAYGAASQSYWGQNRTASGICWEDSYNSISEIPQSILIAKKIIIKDTVTYLDSWLIADEIITCDPKAGWNNSVSESDINSKNCNKQLTINGPVMAKNLKLFRTHGGGFSGSTSQLASPAEIFTMSPEIYLWSYNQAQRYSQATTTYARELAPRY